MNVIVIGAGNSGRAAAHLSKEGDTVVLRNRSRETIAGLLTRENRAPRGNPKVNTPYR